jgi:hypothetical protein
MAAQAEDVIDDHIPSKARQIVSDAVESFTEGVTKVVRVLSGGSTSNGHDYSPVESNDQLELQHQPSPQVPGTSAPETFSVGDGMQYLERKPSGGGSTDAASSSRLAVGSRTRVLSARSTSNGLPNTDDQTFSGDGQVELKVLTAAATPLQVPGTSAPNKSDNQDDPSSHQPISSNGTSITLPNPLSSSPGTRSRRRLYLIALVAILISAGTVFAWKSQQVTDANGTNPKKREREINSSDFFSPDANSSDFMALNHSYVYFLNSSRTAARSSCSYYSCSSCLYYDNGCGWCVPSGRCSSGTEGYTYDSWCVGGYQRIDWIWYSSDCPSRCAVGSYSSTGNVCRPPLTTTLSLLTDVSLVNPLPLSPFHRRLARIVLLVVFNPIVDQLRANIAQLERTVLHPVKVHAPHVQLDPIRAQEVRLTAFIALPAHIAAEGQCRARRAPVALISPTAGSRAVVCVQLVLTAAALVRLRVHRALPGRSKDLPGSRFVSRVLLAHTAAAVKCLALHALQARTKAELDNRVALLALPVHTAATGKILAVHVLLGRTVREVYRTHCLAASPRALPAATHGFAIVNLSAAG